LNALKNLKRENDIKIAVLKSQFKDCGRLYSGYSDIAQTYYSISKGDYVSGLVEAERERRERKKKKDRGLGN